MQSALTPEGRGGENSPRGGSVAVGLADGCALPPGRQEGGSCRGDWDETKTSSGKPQAVRFRTVPLALASSLLPTLRRPHQL